MINVRELEEQRLEILPDREVMSLLAIDLSAALSVDVAVGHAVELQAEASVDAAVAVG